MRLSLTLGDFGLQMRAGGGCAIDSRPRCPGRRAQLLIVLYIDRIVVFRLILFRIANGRPAAQAPRRHEPMGRV
jgi:hypothetical protein